MDSPMDPHRLTTGSLVKQLKLQDGRLYYWKVAGFGPEYGWVSVSLQGQHQLLRTEKMPWDYVASEVALRQVQMARQKPEVPALQDIARGAYSYYHQVAFQETKGTGLRMSACLTAMDELRSELYEQADMSVNSFANVRDPIVEVSVELRPSIKQLSKDNADDGLLYTHPDSRGVVLSWLRCEAQFGWPSAMRRTEEQTVYLVGKNKHGPPKRTPIAQARFVQAFCDVDSVEAESLQGSEWQQDFNRFWAQPKAKYSSQRLNVSTLSQMYPAGRPFKPNFFKKVSWRMSHSFEDMWANLYHAKVAELLWDANKLAGGAYATLLEIDSEPQAMAVRFIKNMFVDTVYDIFCFLDSRLLKAVYYIAPEGSTQPSDFVLAVCGIYKWVGVPVDGKTLTTEDHLVLGIEDSHALMAYAKGTSAADGPTCDLSALPALDIRDRFGPRS